MSNPLPYLIRMLLFLVAVGVLGWVLHEDLLRVFTNTPILDSVILGVLVIGIFFVFRQVLLLWPEVSWMRRYQHRDADSPVPPTHSINLLAPMATMLGERDQFRLSPTATRAVLDGIATRLDERRELARYIIGLLIFLGLLGTFWGLLQTIGAVADAINSLQVTAGDPVQMFAKLKASLEGPLTGMSTAFGASLFGLSGSLVLGFLELQASQAQGRFHIELEEWLARATSLSSAGLSTAPQSVPAYVEALLERNTEGVDGLIRALQRIEDSRQSAAAGNAALVERLAALAEALRAQQTLLARFTELSIELRAAVSRLNERSTAADTDREAMLAHQRNIEGQLGRLVEESMRSRSVLVDELRGALGRPPDREVLLAEQREAVQQATAHVGAEVARLAEESDRARVALLEELRGLANRVADRSTIEADRAAVETHHRSVAAELGRLSEQSAHLRSQISRELQGAVGRLTDRSAAEADREALAAHQRTIEGHLARLSEENARNRTALAEEVRGAVSRLTERFADSDHDTLAQHQRNIEVHLARLIEDSALSRTALADDLRGELRLLARTIALARGQDAREPTAGS